MCKPYFEVKLSAELKKNLIPFKQSKETGHYANTPLQYTAIIHGCKSVTFQMFFIVFFLIFAQNIDCGYTF